MLHVCTYICKSAFCFSGSRRPALGLPCDIRRPGAPSVFFVLIPLCAPRVACPLLPLSALEWCAARGIEGTLGAMDDDMDSPQWLWSSGGDPWAPMDIGDGPL